MRSTLAAAALSLLAAALPAQPPVTVGAHCSPEAQRVRATPARRLPAVPDVLVIVLDDVGWLDAFASYGSQTPTAQFPNLASIAAQGCLFENCLSAPTCAPSRRAIQFGCQWTTNTGPACQAPDAFTPKLAEKSIAEAMPGYAAALFGKWHGGGCQISQWSYIRAPQSQGYPYWFDGVIGNLNGGAICGGTGYYLWSRVQDLNGAISSSVQTTYEPDALVADLLALYPLAPSPKLTVVCPSLAHDPFQSPPGVSPLLPTADKFRAMCAHLDAQLAQIVAAVDLVHTVVVIVGDNGTPPQVAPDPQRAKASCYQRGVRVPLVVLGQGVQPGTVVSDLVWVGDILATCAELAGSAAPTGGPYPVASLSLLPYLSGGAPAQPRDHVIGGDLWDIPGTGGTRFVETSDGWKLIQWDDNGDLAVDREELYDTAADSAETSDQLSLQMSRASAMRTVLAAEARP